VIDSTTPAATTGDIAAGQSIRLSIATPTAAVTTQ